VPHLFRKINRYLALDSSGRTPTGDLEERYRIIRRKFGTRRAAFWYLDAGHPIRRADCLVGHQEADQGGDRLGDIGGNVPEDSILDA